MLSMGIWLPQLPQYSQRHSQDLVARLNQVREVRDDLLGMDFTKVGQWGEPAVGYHGNVFCPKGFVPPPQGGHF